MIRRTLDGKIERDLDPCPQAASQSRRKSSSVPSSDGSLMAPFGRADGIGAARISGSPSARCCAPCD